MEQSYHDIMLDSDRHKWTTTLHAGMGSVSLLDVMPRLCPSGQTADFAIVQAARVSYGQGTKKMESDESLIRYLLRNKHTTPFEMIEFKFHCVMPIFIARQWMRHRTSSINEHSGRYSMVEDKFYKPREFRLQSRDNKQGGEIETNCVDVNVLDDCVGKSYELYKLLLQNGISRELSRIVLPQSTYTEFYWKINLHNLFHFLELRMDTLAQKEIRDYANKIFEMISRIVPVSCQAFRDYRLNSIHLTQMEVDTIKAGGDYKLKGSSNKRELQEWENKKKKLHI